MLFYPWVSCIGFGVRQYVIPTFYISQGVLWLNQISFFWSIIMEKLQVIVFGLLMDLFLTSPMNLCLGVSGCVVNLVLIWF